MRINSLPDVKCFCNNKNVLYAQSMVRHFVRHPVYIFITYFMISYNIINVGIYLPTVLSFRHVRTTVFSLLGYEVVCVHLEIIQNN